MSKLKTIAVLVLSLSAFCYTGFLLGRMYELDRLTNIAAHGSQKINLNSFWRVYKLLQEEYVDPSKLDNVRMSYGAIAGMVSSIGDQHTMFLPQISTDR